MKDRIERRFVPFTELRAGEGELEGRLVGHAAVFNQWSTIAEPLFGGLWEESVAPGAFKKTIREADIRALWNHDPNIVLGRNKAKTLELAEDETGLAVTITPPDNEWGRPVMDAVRRGDVSGMSIAFQVVKETWTKPDPKAEPGKLRQRTVKEARLFDVSPVTFPAFPQTDVGLRSEETEAVSRLVAGFRAARLAELGLPLDADERAELRSVVQWMMGVSGEPEAPDEGANHSPEAQDDEPGKEPVTPVQVDFRHSPEARARELQLMKLAMEGVR